MSTKKKWQQSEIETLRQMIASGKTCKDVALAINRTRKSVQHYFNKLGLAYKHPEVGDKINRLTIIEKYNIYKHGQNNTYARCECECGATVHIRLSVLVAEKVKSCGCLKKEKAAARCRAKIIHGDSNARMYRIWAGMKNRCYNANCQEFLWYGDRGISVCDEWRYSYQMFKSWALNNGYNDSLSLDRIDVNGHYEPSNCRWATPQAQAENRTTTIRNKITLTAFGETKTLREWLRDERCRVNSVSSLCYRIGAGWTPEEVINQPSERKK